VNGTGSSFIRRLHITCTDRSTHPRAVITVLDWNRERGPLYYIPTRRDGPWDPPSQDSPNYQFECPRCGRHWQLKPETWERVAKGCITARLADVDLSQLPF